MPTGNVSATIQSWCQIDNRSPAATSNSIVGSSNPHYSMALPVSLPGELTTRTSDTAGIVTTDAAHGLTGTETIAIFWDDAGVTKCAYGAAIDSVTSDTVTFSGAAGDVLPSATSGTTPGESVWVAEGGILTDDVHIPSGADLLALQITSNYEGLCVLLSDGGTGDDLVQLAEIVTSTAPYIWPVPADAASVIAGDIVQIQMYNYNATIASTMSCDGVGA